MTAFPVTKLPPHPLGNTNTLWASLCYYEKEGERGRGREGQTERNERGVKN